MSRLFRITEWLHLYSGLAAAPLLLLLGFSGCILTFQYPLDRTLNPSLNYVAPQPTRASLDSLRSTLLAAYPSARILNLTLSPYSTAPSLAYTGQLALPAHSPFTIYLDPYTARILGEKHTRTFTSFILDLHTNLNTGEDGPGAILLMLTSALLLLLSLTGIILWWPRKIFTVAWHASCRRITFDLHNALGFYSFLFMLLFGLTGVIIHWQSIVLPALNHTLHIADSEPSFKASSSATLPLDVIAAAAAQAIPGARITQIAFPKPKGVYRIFMKFPEDHTPLGRTSLLVDPSTATVLWQRTSRSAPVTTRYFRQWNREFHTGDILGWPTRLLMCLMSLILPILAITGPLFWFRRKRRPATP